MVVSRWAMVKVVRPLAELFQRILHQPFALVVQRAGGLVQNQDGRVLQEHPGNGDALLLPAGQLHAPLAHIGVVAVGQLPDEVVRLPASLAAASRPPPGWRRACRRRCFHRSVPENRYTSCCTTPMLLAQAVAAVTLRDVLAVDQDAPAGHVVKPGDQAAQGGLAAAATGLPARCCRRPSPLQVDVAPARSRSSSV